MSAGIILLIICTIIFVLLNIALWVYCGKEEFKKSWQNKKYLEAVLNVLNAVGFIFMILGEVFQKNYLSFTGFCVIILANTIYVIGVIRNKKNTKSDEKVN